MMKKYRAVIALLLCAVLILAFPASGKASSLSSITSDSIKDKQNQISKAEKEKKDLQNMLTDVKKIMKNLESQKNDLKKYVEQLDSNLEEIQNKIAELKNMILDKEKQIEETEAELAEAQRKEENQYEAMKIRLQMMYERGDSYYLDLIFSGDGFVDMLNQLEYAEQLAQYDRDKLNEYMMNRELIEYCKMELEAEKEVLYEAKASVEQEEQALETLISEKEQRIREYETDIDTKQQAVKEYEEDIAAQEQLIKDLEAAVAAEKKKLMEQNMAVMKYDGGVFKFPMASYTRISSPFGMRMHPTLHINKMHNGVDFAAPTGTAIYAAYDGKVVAASYTSVMGNYVMIDHGSGLYTIYMHASKLHVSTGDVVVKGETIAEVGATGRTTGAHLHFGVRLNGEYVSPWNYLSN